MNPVANESLENDGIFVGNPSKQDLINYFMKQQRLATIKKLEEIDRDSSPELSESFEIYLEQKKKKIEMEKRKLNDHKNIQKSPDSKINEIQEKASSDQSLPSNKSPNPNISYNDESFLELEKICEHTLNLNNVSEMLADLTTMDVKNIQKEETRISEIEQPSFFQNSTSLLSSNENSPLKAVHDNRPSTILEETEASISFKTTQSNYQSLQSISSTDKSEYYQTANDKSFGSAFSGTFLIMKPKLKEFYDELINVKNNDSSTSMSNDVSLSNKEIHDESDTPRINDTLDEIDFLLAQAQKLNDDSKSMKKETSIRENDKIKSYSNVSPFKSIDSPQSGEKRKIRNTPKISPLINFSPNINTLSPAYNFKLPKQPSSSSKNSQISKINNKKFQHIVSPISRYIQTSESVLNANAHVQYKGRTFSKKHFNFRDSENFNESIDKSINGSSLPLRAKTINLGNKQITDNGLSPRFAVHRGQIITQNKLNIFANNTLDESQISKQNHTDLSLLSDED